jgi:predicted nucleic acid-binding protein
MRLVVADSSPLNYLVWIEQVEILPALFERIFVPEVVQNELRHSEAPESVRRWIAAPPSWLEVVPEEHESGDPDLLRLDDGERAAILLALGYR